MHAVVRTYSGKGAKEVFDVLEKRTPELETLMRQISGFVAYSLVRTNDGGFSVSVFNDKAGTDQSIKLARDWIKENAPNAAGAAPAIAEGKVILHLK